MNRTGHFLTRPTHGHHAAFGQHRAAHFLTWATRGHRAVLGPHRPRARAVHVSTTSPEVFVTNFHTRFTGVSATANAVVSGHQQQFDLRLVGTALPLAPKPISYIHALELSRRPPANRPFAIWHVRRNLEMSAALLARDVFRLPIRIVFTSAAQRFHSAIPRSLIARMDAVVATTEKAATFVPHVVGVVPHGVDTERFRPAADRDAEWTEAGHGGQFGIGIVGRVREEKGTDLFVEALCRVLPERPDFTALIIGRAKPTEYAFEKALRERIRRAKLTERVRFLGEVPATEMPAVMRSLSLLVAPARYEGYGMTPLEAMSCGVAVVASDTGAYSAMVVPGETGLIVPIDDVDALAAGILETTADPQRLRQWGAQGRQRVLDTHSLAGEMSSIARVYERLWNGERL